MKSMLLSAAAMTLLACLPLQAQKKNLDSAVFGKDEITFADHPGLVFRLSKPYMRYQEWDKEHTGDASFAIALEFTNKSQQNITAISFIVKLYDKKGKILSDYTCSTSPMTIRPKDGSVLKPGYRGVDPYFGGGFSDKTYFEKFGKLDFKITEVKTSSVSESEKPVFDGAWQTFKDFPGISARLSKPFILLDEMSGDERFAIGMEFKNESKKPVKFLYYQTRVFDDQGPVYENEIQEFGDKYIPALSSFPAEFPDGYSGTNKSFYIGEKSLFKKFKKIEIELTKVE
jgi:hypothetical protein